MCNLPRLQARQCIARDRPCPDYWRKAAVFTWVLLSFSPALPGAGTIQSDYAANHPKVTAIRFWSLGDVTRIAIESSGEFHFHFDRLRNPERVFFDIVGAKPDLATFAKGRNIIAVGDHFIRQIRVAETQRGITRIVLDLENDVEFSTSQLANPDRLIIELHAPAAGRLPLSAARAVAAKNIPMEPSGIPAERTSPRQAILDFSVQDRRRQLILMAPQPSLPNPPSSLDPATRLTPHYFNQYDPWFALRLPPVAALPPPVRAKRVMPGVLAKVAPAPVAAPIREVLADPTLPTASLAVTSAKASPIPNEIGLPAKRTSQGDTLTRVLGLKLGRVVIDPGHGGHDAGTTGPEGLHEKDVALDVGKRLGSLIQERLGSEVVFTRTDDTFIPLSRRTQIANEIKADLFLSIHVNSSPLKTVGGVETYFLNFTTSKSALETAMRENAGADRNVGELQDLLKKIALKDKADESREFASRIQMSLCMLEPKANRANRDRGVKRAPFVVLIGASMPSVLAEVGFISNAHDETMMRKPEYRQKLAEALFKGVSSYANSLSHFQLAQQSGKLDKVETSPQE